MIYNKPIISIKSERGNILFSGKFYDQFGNLKLQISDNVCEVDTNVTDIRYSENNEDSQLVVKMKNSESYLSLKVKQGKLHIEGKFYADGQICDINDKGVFVLNKQQLTMSGNLFENCHSGINVTKDGVGIG